MPEIEAHYRAASVSGAPGSVVIAEGRS
jgi:hypothetical protein